MTYAVVVPVTYHDLLQAPSSFQWIDYFHRHSVKTFVCVNKCSVQEAHSLESRYCLMPDTFFLVYGGVEGNPYVARNAGLHAAFAHSDVDAVALIDSESIVHDDFHGIISKCAADGVYAGRVKTYIPRGVSNHLDWLAGKNFECFDGFNAPDATMGGNMTIGRAVFNALGDMRSSTISGGDHEYGVRAKECGVTVKPIEALVYKIINKYTYRTIIEKQLRRAQNATKGKLPASQVIPALRAALLRKAAALEGCNEVEDLKGNYDKLIDGLFSVMWFESLLADIIDGAP